MKLFDTHAHLNFPDYDQDYREVWQRAKETGLVGLINVGTDLATSRRAVEQAHELSIWASVGVHPHEASHHVENDDWRRSMAELVNNERVVAVGEVGFDYYRQGFDADHQEQVLEYFLGLARREEKAVLFHCRPSGQGLDAYEDLLSVIGKQRTVYGVIHAFGGDEATAKKILNSDLYLSFTAQVTYPKNYDLYAKLFKVIPLDRIMLETDCPFLPPEGLRGERNEPRHVDVVAQSIAKFTGRSKEEVAEKTTENAIDLFRISF